MAAKDLVRYPKGSEEAKAAASHAGKASAARKRMFKALKADKDLPKIQAAFITPLRSGNVKELADACKDADAKFPEFGVVFQICSRALLSKDPMDALKAVQTITDIVFGKNIVVKGGADGEGGITFNITRSDADAIDKLAK